MEDQSSFYANSQCRSDPSEVKQGQRTTVEGTPSYSQVGKRFSNGHVGVTLAWLVHHWTSSFPVRE